MKTQPDDSMGAGKYGLVLDIIEHPDRYTSEQLAEILTDPETREIYNLLCKTDSAIKSAKEIDVDAEWENFARKQNLRASSGDRPAARSFRWFGSRAASIAAIVCTSIVAVAAGIAITVSVINRPAESAQGLVETVSKSAPIAVIVGSDTIPADTVMTVTAPVMFEDQTLETIMTTVAATYGVEVKFNSPEVAALHLYYKLDPSLPLDEVIAQLNTFEQINIRRNGNTLTID